MAEPTNETLPIEIGVEDVKRLLDTETQLLLVDCREQPEVDFCQIDGALVIPMNETPHRVNELEPHRNHRIIVFCHHGTRSLMVAQWLRMQGFDSAQNMTGGIDVWSQLIDPDVPRY